MRYKIAYALPWLPQKNVLNAHSHFAFAGWLSQVLMVLMVAYLGRQSPGSGLRRYNWLLWANLATAWGMLLSFPWEGYGAISIVFSTLSIFVSYAFAFVYWRDLNRLPARDITHLWFKAALVWNVLSSLGAFSLAYMMAADIRHEHWYLAAIYYFLHFQYNGWFFFACGGLLYSANKGCERPARLVFYLFAIACAPAYLLSVLWAKLPAGAFTAAFISAALQLIAGFALLGHIRKGQILLVRDVTKTVRVLLLFAAVAAGAKFLLQAGSLHPGLAKLAFGFHPIVIGYLHLVLLGVITIFVIAYLKHHLFIPPGNQRRTGMIVFVSGIVVQEILLMVQGVMAMAYKSVPFINEALFGAALMMLLGIALLNIGMGRNLPQEAAAQTALGG
jgi:hypothetical protein